MKTKLLSVVLLLTFLSLFNQTYAQDFYPLNDGDFWEYVQEDTLTLDSGELGTREYSYTKEIISDTLMPNGIAYKKIKRINAANSVNNAPRYEYERKDASGNIYIYYNNQDILLYDFSKVNGDTYPSHFPGLSWTVSKWTEIKFGKERQLFGFTIKSNDYAFIIRIMADSLGVIEYAESDPYADPFSDTAIFKNGYLWGALTNGERMGDLLADKQKIDWNEYYPLHVGDFWVYRGRKPMMGPLGPVMQEYERIVKVKNDTIMPDGNRYFNKDGQYERIDSLGYVYAWINNSPIKILEFSSVLGDTYNHKESYLVWGKNEVMHNYFLRFYHNYQDGAPSSNNWYAYQKGVGLVDLLVEEVPNNNNNIDEELKGAYINWQVFGDTVINLNIVISIEDEAEIITNYALDQNYPNPFNPATNITFQLPKESFVSLIIYDMLGEKVETLLNEYRGVGEHTITFNAHNLPSGIYFYTLQTNGLTETKKMLLLK